MSRKNDKKSRLIQAAYHLFREKSYCSTTLAMIAHSADVPLGNVYYYFKSKEAILSAVVDRFTQDFHQKITMFNEQPTQRDRIRIFVQSIVEQANDLALHGEPLISLAREMRLEEESLRQKITDLMHCLTKWINQQFLGLSSDPQQQAHDLLQRIYGIIAIANCSNNPQYIVDHCGKILSEIQ